MTEPSDLAYFQARARQERALAAQADDLSARRAHDRLAEAYERKAEGTEWRTGPLRSGRPRPEPALPLSNGDPG